MLLYTWTVTSLTHSFMFVSCIINVQLRVPQQLWWPLKHSTQSLLSCLYACCRQGYLYFTNKTLSSVCVDIALETPAVSLTTVSGCRCRRRDSGDPWMWTPCLWRCPSRSGLSQSCGHWAPESWNLQPGNTVYTVLSALWLQHTYNCWTSQCYKVSMKPNSKYVTIVIRLSSSSEYYFCILFMDFALNYFFL